MENIEGGAGEEAIAKAMTALFNDPLFKLRQTGTQSQADAIRNADRMVDAITPAVTRLTELQDEFPILTEAVKGLTSVMMSVGGVLLAERILGRGGLSAAEAAAAVEKAGLDASGMPGAKAKPPGKLTGMSRGMKGAGIAGLLLSVAEPWIRESGEDMPASWLWNDKAFRKMFGKSSIDSDDPAQPVTLAPWLRDLLGGDKPGSGPAQKEKWQGTIRVQVDGPATVRDVRSDDDRVNLSVDSGMRSTQ